MSIVCPVCKEELQGDSTRCFCGYEYDSPSAQEGNSLSTAEPIKFIETRKSEREIMERRTALGFVVGLAISLLIVSEQVVIARYPILYSIVFSFGLIIIIPIVVGVKIGILLVRKMVRRDFSWSVIALLALVLWPTTVAIPFGVQILSMRHTAQNAVPTYPGSHHVETTVKLGDGENDGDRVSIRFVAESDLSSLLNFYRMELANRGWEEGPQHFIESKKDDTPYWFQHERTHEYLHIKIWPPEQQRTIKYEVVFGL